MPILAAANVHYRCELESHVQHGGNLGCCNGGEYRAFSGSGVEAGNADEDGTFDMNDGVVKLVFFFFDMSSIDRQKILRLSCIVVLLRMGAKHCCKGVRTREPGHASCATPLTPTLLWRL